ncbi:4Fe-4S binding protein [Clostridium sp.]|uniref:4Fe-4S binding protein n=1 Tax=Clostridium sp. TaxID=1506 RepID=UPI002FC5C2D1
MNLVSLYAVIKVIDYLEARPKVNLKNCKQCNMCLESCPVDAINTGTKEINYDVCIECLCLHKAVELKKVNPVAGIAMKLFRGNDN